MKRLLGRVVVGMAVVAIGSMAASCGGSKSSGGKSKSGDDQVNVLDLQEEVQGLLEEAEKAGMDKVSAANFERVQKQVEDGGAALDDGKEADARKKLSAAKKTLKTFVADRAKVKEAIEKVAPVKQEVEAAKKKAVLAKASENAKEPFDRASEAYKDALAELEKADTDKSVQAAKARLQQAKKDFEEATALAQENATYRKRSEAEKTSMENWKKKAQDKKAEDLVPELWLSAAQTEREAADYMEKSEFRMAIDAYKDAAQRYVMAMKGVEEREALAAQAKEAEEREKAYLAGLQNQGDSEGSALEGGNIEVDATPDASADTPEAGMEPAAPEPAPGPATPAEPAASSASIATFESYDPSKYPQELDAEDEAFLEQYVSKLVSSSGFQYDSASGAARLEYVVGSEIKKDLIVLAGGKDNIKYEGLIVDTRKMTADEKRKNAEFALEGNTMGLVALPVPFRFWVKVEYEMQIMTMDKSGTFAVILMMDPKKRDRGYATQWLNVGLFSGGVPKAGGAPPQYSGSADRWFLKTRAVPMVSEFVMPDPQKGGDPLKSGRLSVTYDVGGDGSATTTAPLKNYQGGLVGFHWSRTKFQVRNLVVTGILDKKAAVEILRKKTGVAKEGGAETTKATGKTPKATAKTPKATAKAPPTEPKEPPEEPAEKPEAEPADAPAEEPADAPGGGGADGETAEGAGGGTDESGGAGW